MKKFFMLFLLVSVSVFFVACNQNEKPLLESSDYGLAQVRDLEELKTLMKTDEGTALTRFFSALRGDFAVGAPENSMDDSADGPSGDGNANTSKTNVQVEGVDEGDIVKVDQNRIYSIKYDRLQVVNLLGQGQMEIALQETIQSVSQGYYSDLYITKDYLVVIGQRYDYIYLDINEGVRKDDDAREFIDMPYYGYYGTPITQVIIYDINTLERLDTYEVSGNLLSSRLIDESLYLISNHYVYSNDQSVDPRPMFMHNDDLLVPEFPEIKYLPGVPNESFTIITHIELKDTVTMDYDIFLGTASWGQIHVSLNAIYLATTVYERTFTGNYRQSGRIISYLFEEDGSVTYGGAGEFKGYVINQFAMDEYDGYFRMVTTEGWGDSVKNRLYVFERQSNSDGKRELTRVGFLDEGIGKPRETVRSVRFVNDRVTVVTFEIIDPFYYIDLSDPTNPTILGELEITGFSTYQHPWTDDLVLGVGYETNINGMIIGIKLALYDISNPTTVTEHGEPLVMLNQNNSWQYGEALHNHKAILIAKEHNFIGFSIQRAYWFDYNYQQTSDYILFAIDETSETPITIEATLSHQHLYVDYEDLYQDYYWYYSYNFSIDRAVYVGDVLYVISGEAITSHAIDDAYALIESLVFLQQANK